MARIAPFDARMGAMLDALPMFVLALDSDFQVCFANHAAVEFVGLADSDAFVVAYREQNYLGLLPADLANKARTWLDNARRSPQIGAVGPFEVKIPRPTDQQERVFTVRLSAIGQGGNEPRLFFAEDVTALRIAQASHDADASHMAAIYATVPDAMVVIDERGFIANFSAAASSLFGYSSQEAIGQNVSLLMPGPHSDKHDNYLMRYIQTGEKRIIGTGRIVEGKRKDESRFPMELYIGESNSNDHRYFTGFVRDLSARFLQEARLQEMQAEIAHSARLSSMGTLASALAHELNQPLTAIANYMSAGRDLLATSQENPLLQEAMDEASREALRAGQIVRRLRDFVSKRETQREVLTLSKIISDATTLGLVGARELGVTWSIDIGDTGSVIADRVQVQQVLVNLIRNAIEAMQDCSQKHLTIRAKNISPRQVEISVADTGSGLAPEMAGQLFQPFITTKPCGMGLGLSICRTIVEAHGGHLSAHDHDGGGTVFAFTLNRDDGEAPHDA